MSDITETVARRLVVATTPLYCDLGPHAGKWRVQLEPLYVTAEEWSEFQRWRTSRRSGKEEQ